MPVALFLYLECLICLLLPVPEPFLSVCTHSRGIPSVLTL